MLKKCILTAICLSILFLCASCSQYEVEKSEEYKEFHQKMEKMKNPMFEIFPSLENEDCIDDMYLFYSERDLIDTYYTCYLNCIYDEEAYCREVKRITEVFTNEDLLKKNSESFEYESLSYSGDLTQDIDGVSYMRYEYVLFIESEYRIVYITFFDKELYGKSVNIPEQYLPKELVDLRNSYEDKQQSWEKGMEWFEKNWFEFLLNG